MKDTVDSERANPHGFFEVWWRVADELRMHASFRLLVEAERYIIARGQQEQALIRVQMAAARRLLKQLPRTRAIDLREGAYWRAHQRPSDRCLFVLTHFIRATPLGEHRPAGRTAIAYRSTKSQQRYAMLPQRCGQWRQRRAQVKGTQSAVMADSWRALELAWIVGASV